MFTRNITTKADRLRASLDAIGLSYVLFEVPTVHRSISARGSDNIAFCKPNFIRWVSRREQTNLLYVDADIVFKARPTAIEAAGDADFAVYNWLADRTTDAYSPVPVPYKGKTVPDRFYQYSHGVDIYDPTQLLCSGAVQFWRRSAEADSLLQAWHQATAQYPNVEDDQLLDHAYNAGGHGVKPLWLPKEYCRYAWWIYAKPVIDHPEFPTPSLPERQFDRVAGRDRLDRSRVQRLPPNPPFPRNCLIDMQENRVLQIPPPEKWVMTPLRERLWK